MIDLERLRAVNEIIVHDYCPDGRASAMILHDILPDAKITFCQYNTELHKTLEAKPGLLFCDFSPHPSRWQEFLDVGAIVLDHHGGPAATVTREFQSKGLGVFADEKADPGVCGAVLAYRHVWEPLYRSLRIPGDVSPRPTAMRELARLAGIRDTWQKNDPSWRGACEQAEALMFWPWERIAQTSWMTWYSELLSIGPILFDRNVKKVDRCIEGAYRFTSSTGIRVTVFEGTKPSSDASEVMGDTNDLTVGLAFFVEDGVAKMVFSNRSRGSFHCQNFALAHGGGGHVQAAGFSVPLMPDTPNPFELVRRVVARYEPHIEEWAKITAEPTFGDRVKKGEIVPKNEFDKLVKSVWDPKDVITMTPAAWMTLTGFSTAPLNRKVEVTPEGSYRFFLDSDEEWVVEPGGGFSIRKKVVSTT